VSGTVSRQAGNLQYLGRVKIQNQSPGGSRSFINHKIFFH
jgi:hypothetical protein